MDNIRARKVHSLSGQDPAATEDFFNQSSSSSLTGKLHHHPTSSLPSSNTIEFRYSHELFIALLIPIGILLAFGGNFSFITIGFGFLITYIFDLLGTVEGTYMTLILTTFILWITLVWAARLLLLESRWNLSLVFTMGILLFLTVVTMSSQFRNLLKEFSELFYFLETVIFASLPMIASVIVTWFLCVEVPTLDVSFCFSSVYFCYMVYLGRPRVSSYPYTGSYAKDLKFRHTCFVLNGSLIRVMSSIPVVMSPLLAVAVKVNSLYSIRVTDFAFSFLFPLFLMLMSNDQFSAYFPYDDQKYSILNSSSSKVISAAMLFVCVQGHPVFSDLKTFSTLSDPLASAALCGAVMLGIVGVGIHRSDNIRDPDDDFTEQRQNTVSLVKRIMVDVCMGAAGFLGGLLLRLPWSALFIAIVFPVALAEYYQRTNGKSDSESRVTNILIAILAAMSAAAIALCYCIETVFFYSFEFHWNAYNVGLREFSFLIVIMAALAVLSPMLLYDNKKNAATHLRLGRDIDSFLPTAMYDGFKGVVGAAINPFQMIFSLGSAAVAFIELLVREQDWTNHSSTAALVYPHPVFIGTAVLLCFSAAHLYNNKAIRAWCVWTVFISQALKLTHLAGVSPHDSLAIGALIRAYTFPFVCHCIESTEDEVDEEIYKDVKRGGYGVGLPLILFYMGMAAVATYYAKERVIAQLLVLLTWKDSGDAQHWTACLCMYCALIATLLRVFMRRFRIARSVFIILAIGFALLTSETLSVGLTLSTSFPYIYINSVESGLLLPHAAAAHTGLFAALTLVLVVAAVTSAFPTRRPLSRLFFAVLFSACASRALLGWGFRDTLEEDKMDWLSRPSIYCFFSTLFSTFAALNGSLPRSSYAAVVVFLCAAFIPITTVLFIWFTVGLDTLNDYINGIVWVAAVLHAGIGISVRAIELMRDVEAMQSLKTSIDSSGHGGGVLSRENPVAGRICLATAGLCMMWTLVASLGISSSVGSVLGPDLLIPLSSLVLLCTRKGGIIPDKHPLVVSALIASICWLSSAIISIFILRDDTNYDPFKDGAFNIFKDGTVSIWTSQSMFMPGLHICLCLSPLPALLLSFIRVPGINEEMMFMLAIISLTAVVGSQIASLRYLGLVGVVMGFWRCSDLGQAKRVSNRLI